MQSPFKRILVYDLETGGLSSKFNSITEIAIVAIDMESLKIIEEFSVMLQPRLDLNYRDESPLKEAKMFYKNLATKDEVTKMKLLMYKGEKITLKNLGTLEEDIAKFYIELDKVYKDNILNYEDILDLENSEFKDIVKLYFDNSYNPQALEVTKISRELMVKEGVSYEEAFSQINEVIKRHTIGNSKPIIAGHNIGSVPPAEKKGPDGFDNPFMYKFFSNFKVNFFNVINTMIIDTLKWARIRWWELPSYSLGVCANEVGLTLKEAHRALPDTIANANFLIKMFRNLRGEGSGASTYKRKKFKFNF